MVLFLNVLKLRLKHGKLLCFKDEDGAVRCFTSGAKFLVFVFVVG